jgi:phosphoacetylglucosamine mutase
VIDGDKQFALIMLYITQLLETLDLENSVDTCLVNTAYCNTAAREYLNINDIKNVCVPTGVKNAHPVVQQYVIGANDEPNGHGTVCYKKDWLDRALDGKEDNIHARRLRAFLAISNVYVGDSICNLLMIEAVLRAKNYSMENFSNMYRELPNKMFKAVVADRTAFRTVWDETKLTEPQMLQDIIELFSKDFKKGRAFVRPSGTEDILRLYVEAATMDDVENLARIILAEIEN